MAHLSRLEPLRRDASICDRTSTWTLTSGYSINCLVALEREAWCNEYWIQHSSRAWTSGQRLWSPGKNHEPVSLATWHNWQLAKKKIAISHEVTIPSDSQSAALLEAHKRKLQSYTPLLGALQEYVHSEWTVSILPSVVRVQRWSSTANGHQLSSSMNFAKWSAIINNTVYMSVAALAYMNWVWFAPTWDQ